MPRRSAALALSLLFAAAVAGDECKFTGPSGNDYDLSLMTRTSGDDYTKTIQVGPNIQFIYRINVCGNTVVKCQNQEAPATEALKIPAGETCRVLGRMDGAKYEEAPVPASSTNPDGAGVKVTYSGGDICDPTARTTRSVTLNIQCSTSETDTTIAEVKKEGTCSTTFQMTSPHACPVSSGGSGSTILILGALLVAVYLIGGAAYKYKKHGARGVEAIPNIDFWRDLPGLVSDGCKYSYHKLQDIKDRFSGSSSSSGGDAF